MRQLALVFIAGTMLAQIPNRQDPRMTLDYNLLTPAGKVSVFPARSLDTVLSADGSRLYVKEHNGLRVIATKTWTQVFQESPKEGGSPTGIALSPDGKTLLYSTTGDKVKAYDLDGRGIPKFARDLEVGKDTSFPCGMAFRGNGASFLVCLSRSNQLAEVAWPSGEVVRTVDTGVAPFDVVVSRDGTKAFVSCQGGTRPRAGEKTAKSSGTDVAVDVRGIAKTGCVTTVDLKSGKSLGDTLVPLQPCALTLLGDRPLFAVANANADSVTLISTSKLSVVRTIRVKPDGALPFGSMPNGLASTPDGNTLYVSLAGNNAVAVLDVRDPAHTVTKGFIPTAWYPGSLALSADRLFIANVKGYGSTAKRRESEKGKNSWDLTGAVQSVSLKYDLVEGARIVRKNARVPEILRANERSAARKAVHPVPVPAKLGEPSVFDHVVYVIKENRTYDQVFGDVSTGDGDPKLCVYGESVTPNQHALVRRYVLLDNYYCNGVCSADGHAWAIEGNVTPYLEQEFGGFSRNYDYGSDPITFSQSGFLWEPILAKGLSFRNFGELDTATPPKGWSLKQAWSQTPGGDRTVFGQSIDVERLRDYSCRSYPGWSMAIPDQLRMDRFMEEFKQWERSGHMPNFVIVYLPQDHTAGTTPGYPQTKSYVADNDLALGRLVDAISHSPFWKSTVIFSNEDDPQNGFDHVDGNRSTITIASPYAKRGVTVKQFYNQNSVLHTILRIFGLPAMNQKIAEAPLMTECFTSTPDFSPFEVQKAQVDLLALNPPLEQLSGKRRYYAQKSLDLGFAKPDFGSAEQDKILNRIVWHEAKGYDTPYPDQFEGAHGRGLAGKGAVHDLDADEDDDD